ncbi:translation initiation factor IF-2-like [Zalophus californianus]|uniref:Translation initiation factor IF-2-like n=1 Tax=Zalophus californianus TaxID=9704 RepID=A0A6J2FKD4_ZALCA|nr:translation initiation factor IF-2-like [Zalophus californianus]
MSRGHADALRAGAARSLPSRRCSAPLGSPAPLWTPDSASRRGPPALLAASSRPPLSGGIPNAGGPRPGPGEEAARDRGEARTRRLAGRGGSTGLASPPPRLPEVTLSLGSPAGRCGMWGRRKGTESSSGQPNAHSQAGAEPHEGALLSQPGVPRAGQA